MEPNTCGSGDQEQYSLDKLERHTFHKRIAGLLPHVSNKGFAVLTESRRYTSQLSPRQGEQLCGVRLMLLLYDDGPRIQYKVNHCMSDTGMSRLCFHPLYGKMSTIFLFLSLKWQNRLGSLNRNLFLNRLRHLLEVETLLYKLDMDNCFYQLSLVVGYWCSLCKKNAGMEVFWGPYKFQNKWCTSEILLWLSMLLMPSFLCLQVNH